MKAVKELDEKVNAKDCQIDKFIQHIRANSNVTHTKMQKVKNQQCGEVGGQVHQVQNYLLSKLHSRVVLETWWNKGGDNSSLG